MLLFCNHIFLVILNELIAAMINIAKIMINVTLYSASMLICFQYIHVQILHNLCNIHLHRMADRK